MTTEKGLTVEQLKELKFYLMERPDGILDASIIMDKIRQLQTPKPRLIDADKLEEFMRVRFRSMDGNLSTVGNELIVWIRDNAKTA